jgi:hypothetical protein
VGKIVGHDLDAWARRANDFAHAEKLARCAPLPTLHLADFTVIASEAKQSSRTLDRFVAFGSSQ